MIAADKKAREEEIANRKKILEGLAPGALDSPSSGISPEFGQGQREKQHKAIEYLAGFLRDFNQFMKEKDAGNIPEQRLPEEQGKLKNRSLPDNIPQVPGRSQDQPAENGLNDEFRFETEISPLPFDNQPT